jgi:hypothetical protein
MLEDAMNREDIIKMAREAGFEWNGETLAFDGIWCDEEVELFAALVAAAERNKVAQWMMAQGYATGHGDTTEDLLEELDWQITESWSKVVVASVEAEREACAKVCEDKNTLLAWPTYAAAIRARGQA